MIPPHLPGWIPPLFYLLLATLFLWRVMFVGDIFLPADLLGHLAPWKGGSICTALPPWNPLRWDGIGQFYPWRHFAAQSVQSGTLPLWNPYQFCGTPFVANSQSAVFYPGNLLFYLLPDTARAFGFSALLHLTLCGWFTYLLLKRLRCAELASLVGGVVFAYSAWQVAWLQLPTFLATSCWIPLLLRQIYVIVNLTPGPSPFRRGENVASGASSKRSIERETQSDTLSQSKIENRKSKIPSHIAVLGAIVGLMFLAGHLQIAFYGLLAGTLWAAALLIRRWKENGPTGTLRGLMMYAGGLVLGVMLASPQLLPSIELSRMSHRVSKPSAEGYQSYTEYGLPPAGLALLTLPDLFGADADPQNPYWGYYVKRAGEVSFAIRHNAAETADYVGIVPLLLGLLALARGLKRDTPDRRTLFFGGLAVLALLMALGTPLNALFYFGVPGFGQSGSPARCLVLWALAWACLAAFGLDALFRNPPTRRELGVALGGLLFLCAVGLSLTGRYVAAGLPNMKGVPALGEAFGRIGSDWLRLAIFTVGGAGLLLLRSRETRVWILGGGALLLVTADLFWAGILVNPTTKTERVYPITTGIQYLKDNSGHERIFPVNQRWNLYAPPPAVLPPNAATVYGLRDVQGYDSLFTGQIKAFANQFARPLPNGVTDASPSEVGNMVFFQNPNAPLVPQTAAAFAVTLPADAPGFAPEAVPPGASVAIGDPAMAIYALPSAHPRAELIPSAPGAALSPPAWQEDGPTRVTLATDAPVPSALILRDQLTPGWIALLDGQVVPLQRQEETQVFRSVAVPAGRHTITFRYEPASFRVGLFLALLACGGITAVGITNILSYRSAVS